VNLHEEDAFRHSIDLPYNISDKEDPTSEQREKVGNPLVDLIMDYIEFPLEKLLSKRNSYWCHFKLSRNTFNN
jgi:hypothetical protein